MVRIIIPAGFFAQPAEHLEHNRLSRVVYAIKRRLLAPGIGQIIRDRQITVGLGQLAAGFVFVKRSPNTA